MTTGNQVAIDALPAATLPLGGTEPVPIVQAGVTRQAPASALAGSIPSLSYTIQTVSFTAAVGGRYGLVTSAGPLTVTLPGYVIGAGIEVSDVSKDANVNHITLASHAGDQIVLVTTTATNQTISTAGAVVRLVCYAANRWRALLIASA